MNKWILGICLTGILLSCKHKKKEPAGEIKTFIPVLPLVKAQVARVDTSLYRIFRIETIGDRSDTIDIPRDSFAIYAKDFLDLPDISSEQLKDKYKEDDGYEPILKRIMMTFTANDPDLEVQRETLLLANDENDSSTVRTIIVDRVMNYKDSTVVKNMLWELNQQFQVVTKTQAEGKPENIRTLTVKWIGF